MLDIASGAGITGDAANVVMNAKGTMELTAKDMSVMGTEVSINGSATNVIEGGIVKINS